jgi:type III pantothenate kinase
MKPATYLLIDAGNSTVKAALWGSGELGAVQVWAHAELAAFGAWVDALKELPHHAWLASVADSRVSGTITQQLEARKVPLTRWHSTDLPAGFQNLYEAPTLGPDRLLAALGARHTCAAQVLVVANFGTATTVDLVVNDSFHGGLIAPGVRMMAAGLNRDTAHLPMAEGEFKPVPRTTHDAIFTGVCAAQRGAVDHMLRAAQAFGTPHLLVSGGAAAAVRPVLPAHDLLPHAVLRGLAVVAQAGLASANANAP